MGEAVNLFINENVKEVFDEIKNPAFKVVGDIYGENILYPIFKKVPYKQLFKEKS